MIQDSGTRGSRLCDPKTPDGDGDGLGPLPQHGPIAAGTVNQREINGNGAPPLLPRVPSIDHQPVLQDVQTAASPPSRIPPLAVPSSPQKPSQVAGGRVSQTSHPSIGSPPSEAFSPSPANSIMHPTLQPNVSPSKPKQELPLSPSVDTPQRDSPGEAVRVPAVPNEEPAAEGLPSNIPQQIPSPKSVPEPPLPGSVVSPSLPGAQPPLGANPTPKQPNQKEPKPERMKEGGTAREETAGEENQKMIPNQKDPKQRPNQLLQELLQSPSLPLDLTGGQPEAIP